MLVFTILSFNKFNLSIASNDKKDQGFKKFEENNKNSESKIMQQTFLEEGTGDKKEKSFSKECIESLFAALERSQLNSARL